MTLASARLPRSRRLLGRGLVTLAAAVAVGCLPSSPPPPPTPAPVAPSTSKTPADDPPPDDGRAPEVEPDPQPLGSGIGPDPGPDRAIGAAPDPEHRAEPNPEGAKDGPLLQGGEGRADAPNPRSAEEAPRVGGAGSTPGPRPASPSAGLAGSIPDRAAGDELPLPMGPQSFLAPEEQPAGDALFLRLRSLTIGGDFDAAGSEEVHVFAEVASGRRLLAAQGLSLGSGIETFPLDDPPLLELRPDATTIELTVEDEDLTEWELITATPDPVALPAAAFTPEEAARSLSLSTIRGTSWSFFGGDEPFTLRGAKLELGLLRAPRRTGPDVESRAIVQRVFAAVLDAPSPNGPAPAIDLAARLLPAAREAMGLAARSSHTHVRRALASLAEEGHGLALAARRVGLLDPAHLARRLDAVRAAHESGPAEAWTASKALQDVRVAAQALASRPIEVSEEGLKTLAAAADALEDLEDELRGVETGAAQDALDALGEARRALQGDLVQAAQGLREAPELPARWERLLAAIRREAEEP